VTFEAAVAQFGHPGVVELVVLCGYYTLIAMTLNSFGITPPEGEEPFSD
jgi:4-carboxymuconolactone decarboxylase